MKRRLQNRKVGTILPEPNTFIGAGSGYTTAADIASVTSLSESDIVNFQIDANSNITFYTDTFYTVSGDIKNASYYIDLDGHITSITTAFNGGNGNKRTLIFPSLASCPINCFRGGGLGTKAFWGILSFPLLTPIGTTAANNNCFDYFEADKVYVDDANETNNGGSPDGDIASAIGSNIGTVLNYSANTTAPSEVDDLAVSSILGSVVTLTLTAPTSTNTIEYYIVFVNGVLHSYHSETNIIIGELELSTQYDFKVLVLDEMGNISGFSNTASTTTLSTYQIPTGNIISYWNFDSNSNDQVGSNNGTDTDISYVVGGIVDNKADFTSGVTSKITVADSADLSFGNGTTDSPFSISIWVEFNSTAATQHFVRKGAASTNREYLVRKEASDLQFRLFDQSSGGHITINHAWTPIASTFYHLVCTYDGSGSISGMNIYVDGELVTVVDGSSGTYTAMENLTEPLVFGNISDNTTQSLDGYEDEASIFDIELTKTQISEIYSKNLAGLYLTE